MSSVFLLCSNLLLIALKIRHLRYRHIVARHMALSAASARLTGNIKDAANFAISTIVACWDSMAAVSGMRAMD